MVIVRMRETEEQTVTSPLMATYARSDLTFEKGQGPHLVTTDGETYLDFGGGIAVNTLGHAHPHLVDTVKAQTEKLWHTSNLYEIADQHRLAQRLVDASFADRVFFGNSGAEADECAIKVARRYQWARGKKDRMGIIAFTGAFHGRTLATLAAGGQDKHLEGFGAPMPGFTHVPYGDIDAVNQSIRDDTGAILVEPIQGESGIHVPPSDFLACLRDLCDAHGLLLMVDEVQSGMGRTGKLFAYEWSGIEPDVLTTAKGLGGGFPVGACLATEEACASMSVGTHGSTFGGNPLAMAAGNAVLDILLADGFLAQVNDLAAYLWDGLTRLADQHQKIFSKPRGKGLMVGLKCGPENTSIVKAARDEHLLVVPAADNVIRLLPPLNIDRSHADEAITKLGKVAVTLSND